jgi:hypothetical protein
MFLSDGIGMVQPLTLAVGYTDDDATTKLVASGPRRTVQLSVYQLKRSARQDQLNLQNR